MAASSRRRRGWGVRPALAELEAELDGIDRPIVQVVSRHVPHVDATFGAMLKRSLSLTPHLAAETFPCCS